MNIFVAFKPGDVVKYYSGRYGIVTMEITKIKMVWNKNQEPVIKYGGYVKYTKRRWSNFVYVYNLKNIFLVDGDSK